MNRILLSIVLCFQLTNVHAAWLSKVPVDLPVHSVTAINLGTYIGVRIQKRKTYNKLRALLTKQIEEETARLLGQGQEQDTADDVAYKIKTATNRQLIRFAFEIVNMREELEAQVGEYELASKLSAEVNKQEKERIAECKKLANDALTLEMYQPQLRTALFGTGAISAIMALHRLGLFGGIGNAG